MKEVKQHIFAGISLITATVLGIYAQSITYFLNDAFPTIHLATLITVVTLLSIGIFIITPIILYFSSKTNKKIFVQYLVISIFLGLPISFWSFFVLAMWLH